MYYDPVRHRPNLHIITGHVVDRVLFDEDLRITGVKVCQSKVFVYIYH